MGSPAFAALVLAGLGVGGLAVGFGIERAIEAAARSRVLPSLDALPEAPRIVVLGCRPLARDGSPNPLLIGRVAAAAAAYHHVPHGRLLCTGRLDSSGLHEADEMARALVAAGVPRAAIELDHDASRTIDSIRFLQSHHAGEPIVLVTQDFHLARALFLATRAGLDVTGLPAGGPQPARRVRWRERFARARAGFDSLALHPRPASRNRSRR
jgi:SanA protein